jgi:hypothetical protein
VDIGSACTSIHRRVATKLGSEIEAGNTVNNLFGTCVASVGVVKIKVRVGQPSAVLQVVVVNDKLISKCYTIASLAEAS